MLREAVRFVPAVVWALVIFWLSSRSNLPPAVGAFAGSDKVAHALAYGLLTALLLYGARWPRRTGLWLCAAVAALYGGSDELHQLYVPLRAADPLDWVADVMGAVAVAAIRLARVSSAIAGERR